MNRTSAGTGLVPRPCHKRSNVRFLTSFHILHQTSNDGFVVKGGIDLMSARRITDLRNIKLYSFLTIFVILIRLYLIPTAIGEQFHLPTEPLIKIVVPSFLFIRLRVFMKIPMN